MSSLVLFDIALHNQNTKEIQGYFIDGTVTYFNCAYVISHQMQLFNWWKWLFEQINLEVQNASLYVSKEVEKIAEK